MGFRTYTGDTIDVLFDAKRCIHAAECVNGLPQVFNVKERPWISPDHEEADVIARVVERCPSGALKYLRKDDGAKEKPHDPTTILAKSRGKIYVRGNLHITNEAGEDESLHATRAILCGCGQSDNHPFCDDKKACR